jgi:hypothetical protein
MTNKRREFIPDRMTNNRMAQSKAVRTVVLAVRADLASWFASRLDPGNNLVIEARDADEVLNIVITHSRPIHALLIDDVIGDHQLCGILARYRSKMAIVRVPSRLTEDTCDAALSKVTAALRSSE